MGGGHNGLVAAAYLARHLLVMVLVISVILAILMKLMVAANHLARHLLPDDCYDCELDELDTLEFDGGGIALPGSIFPMIVNIIIMTLVVMMNMMVMMMAITKSKDSKFNIAMYQAWYIHCSI